MQANDRNVIKPESIGSLRVSLVSIALVLLAAWAVPVAPHAGDVILRATTQPYPTNAPATPGPSPTALVPAYPPPYPAPTSISAAPILISATFVTSTSAVVSWQQPPGVPITCLRIYHTGAEWPAGICWRDLPEGEMRVELPGIYAHPAYSPEVGDWLVVAFGMEDVGQATLGEAAVYRLYLPLAHQSAPLVPRAVFLPVFRG
jgi:hypothetical protein